MDPIESPAGTPPGRSRAKRWLTRSFVTIGVLALLLAGLAWLAVQTEWGARLLWQNAPRWTPGQLSGELVGGTLSGGLRLRNIVYRDENMKVQIDRLESDWRLLRSPRKLLVQFLRIGTADVTLLPAPSPPRARTLPQQLALPLAIELQSATVEKLVIHQGATSSHYADIRLQASSDPVRNALQLAHALTPYGLATASVQINAQSPFEVAGTAGLSGKVGTQAYRVDARLSGALQALGIELDVAGKMVNGHAAIEATPFAGVPFRRAQITVQGLDPQAFNAQWPHAALDIRASLAPVGESASDLSQLTVAGPVSLTNAQPGAINQGLLPLVSATLNATLQASVQQFSGITVRLPGKATLSGSGEFRDNGQGLLTLHAERLDLRALHTQLKPTQLGGPLTVQLAGETQQVELELAGPMLSVSAQATLDPKRIALQGAQLRMGSARLELRGSLARDAQAAYSASGTLRDFNPARFFESRPQARVPEARINAEFKAQGALKPELGATVRFVVHDSRYDRLPMTGGGTVRVAGKQLLPSDVQLLIAGNSLRLQGSFGQPSDRLALDIDAPALDRLGFGLSGLLRVDGEIGGTLERPIVDARYRADNLAFGRYRLASLTGKAHTQGVPGTAPDARVTLDLDARGVRSGDILLNRLNARIDGTYASHAIELDATGRVRGEPLNFTLAASGRLRDQPQGLAWDGVLRTLENQSPPRLSLLSPLALAITPGRVEIGAGRLRFAQASIDLQSLRYGDGLVRSEGAFSALEVGQLLALWQQFTGETAAFGTDLVLDGQWNVNLAERASGFVQITRRSGDLRLTGERALGLSALALRADLQGSRVELDAQARAARIGTMAAQGQIGLLREAGRLTLTPRSPVSGRITASIPRVQTLASLAGPRIALTGSADIKLSVGGTLAEPKLSGSVAADGLALTLYDQGVRLRDGIVRLSLENNIVELQHVQFQGGDGTLRATGRITLDRSALGLRANLVADKLQLLASPSGRLTLSGQAVATNESGSLLVTGKFRVDQALFSLPEKAAPELGDDVVVIRGGQTQTAARPGQQARDKPAGAFTPRINIELGVGDAFHFEGAGAELRLAGTLTLRSEPGSEPRAFGTVHVEEGRYEAFGTELAIERGVINFQGSLRNPNVNLVAMRRDQQVAAGVQVTGNVRQPRVQLVSEPNVPQEQKLSWLVFGRGAGGADPGLAQAAAQGAALGLLNQFGTGRLAQTFGLDTFAIGASEFGLTGSQVVNLGKEISDRLYVGYEQSLAGAEGVLKLIYELTPHWSVVVRGGTVAGIDVLYSKRFDSLRRMD